MGLPPQTLGGALRCLSRFRLRLQLRHWFCLAANVLYGAVAPNPTTRSAPWWLRAVLNRYAPVVFLRATQKRCILNARPARRCIPAAVVLRALF